MGLQLRRWVSMLVLRIVEFIAGLASGVFGYGGGKGPSWRLRPDRNAVLMLVSIADVKTSPARLLGERLGTDSWALYLIGAKVHVGDQAHGEQLVAESSAVVGRLRPAGTGIGRVVVDGPGLNGPVYAVFRR